MLYENFRYESVLRLILAFLLTSLISSVNYIINQITDSQFDIKHPEKKHRPIPSGKVLPLQAMILAVSLLTISLLISNYFFNFNFSVGLIGLCIAGILYNTAPVRLKDIPYLDVISESFNNPLRFLLGWYSLGSTTFPPTSYLLLSWTFGAVFMTAKRYDELVFYGKNLGPYRSTFSLYTPTKLLWMMWTYAGISVIVLTSLNVIIGLLLGISLVWFIGRVTSGAARARDIEGFILSPFSNRK
jgi:4-hydroxybenzoate polyprenyltransferase